VNRRKLAPANIVILAAGAVMLIATFMPFYKVPLADQTVTFNAWDRGLFLIATLPALLGAVMALQIGLEAFGNITMPNRMLGLTWDQFHTVLAFQAGLLMLTLLVRARPTLVIVTFTYGTGFWLMLAGSVALVVGALMRVVATGRRPRLL
jgi:hypothetical protein